MSEQKQGLKLPLQDTAAEERILAKILVNPEAIAKVADVLKPESFYLDSHAEIYRAAHTLHSNGKPAYLTTILAWLKSNKRLDKAGGEDKLYSLADRGAVIAGVQDEAVSVADRYVRRQLTTAANEIAELAHTEMPLEEVVNKSQERVYKINLEKMRAGDNKSKSSVEAVIKTKEYIEADNKIFNLGFYDLDYLLGGLEPGTLTVLAGRPSMGKSQGALAICHQIAHLHQVPVVYFSLEMSLVQLECRLWSLISGHSAYKDDWKFSVLKSDRIRRHRARIQPLEDWEREMLNEIAEVAASLPIFINENRAISLQGIWSETRDIIRNHGQLGVVVVDYLQMMAGITEDDNRSYELGKIARGLYNMAGELEVPVVAVSQVSRAVEARTNKRPMMSDLAQSGILEMVADTIVAMYRDEYYNPDSPDRGIIEWLALKARLGETGVAKMLFDPSCGIFRNMQRSN